MKSSWSRKLETAHPAAFSTWCIVAAFGTYFCMYAFRKPFTAAEFASTEFTGGWIPAGAGFKSVLIASQVAGYALSKFLGIKYVSEMPESRRAWGILALIGAAEAALLLFALVPPPWNAITLFFNGLALGMVFGLVLAYLEGRRMTEALAAGLCASFICSSGVVKSVGRVLLEDWNVSEFWMPFLTGCLFVGPLLLFVWMLSRIPAPSSDDVLHRVARKPMDRRRRLAFLRRHAWGLAGLVVTYVLLTIIRSLRDDFAVEIWRDLGESSKPLIYAQSETVVMVGVVVVNGLAIRIHSNRRAFLGALLLVCLGFSLALASVAAFRLSTLSPFLFMVCTGLGLYIPYVAFHTTVFERLIAAFRENANVGYLMYLADATGYLGYVVVLFVKNSVSRQTDFLSLMNVGLIVAGGVALALTAVVALYYSARLVPDRPPEPDLDAASP